MQKKKTAAKTKTSPANSKEEKKQVSIPVIAGIIVIILLLILLAVFIFCPSIFWNKTEKEEAITKTEEEAAAEIIPSPRDALSEEDIEKDIEMETIEVALYSYFIEHERFPDDLEGLMPDFMDEVPKVPGTEDEYNYTAADNNQSFVLSVALGGGGEELMKDDGGDDDNLYEVSGPAPESEPK